MQINLKKYLNCGWQNNFSCVLADRLPSHLMSEAQLFFNFCVEAQEEFYKFLLCERAELVLTCQRCSQTWDFVYQQSHEFVVCQTEAMVEKYQTHYDPLLLPDFFVNMKELLTDNLHLFLPLVHENIDQCDPDQLKLIRSDR